jgi:hypothetical protein
VLIDAAARSEVDRRRRRESGGVTARGSSGWLLAVALMSSKMGLAHGGGWLVAHSSLVAHSVAAAASDTEQWSKTAR